MKRSKSTIRKRKFLPILAVSILALLGIGATFSFYSDSFSFANLFNLNHYEAQYVETFESPNNWKSCDETPKTLVITNKSATPVAARFKMTEYWKVAGSTSTGQTSDLSLTYQNQNAAIINFQNENDWELVDGWYVYKHTLNENESTSSLLKSVTFNCSVNFAGDVTYSADGKSGMTNTTDYQNAKYHLDITAQTVPADQKAQAWGN